jgi:deoxyxylulose-5-phosphate synthase
LAGSLKTNPNEQQAQSKIVAMVGDASIVNGTSFEALNNLGLVLLEALVVVELSVVRRLG